MEALQGSSGLLTTTRSVGNDGVLFQKNLMIMKNKQERRKDLISNRATTATYVHPNSPCGNNFTEDDEF